MKSSILLAFNELPSNFIIMKLFQEKNSYRANTIKEFRANMNDAMAVEYFWKSKVAWKKRIEVPSFELPPAEIMLSIVR